MPRPRFPDRIVQDPAIMAGKPVVQGTRIPVERVIQHLADTPEFNDLFAAYPELTVEDVKACLAYAHTVVAERHHRGRRSSSTSPAAHV